MHNRVSSELLLEEIKSGNRILLCGPPGCGKTARLVAAARSLGWTSVVQPLHLLDRLDLGGAIWPRPEHGVAEQLPLRWLAEVKASTSPVLLIFDDLCKAPVDVQGACKALITRATGALPDHVVVAGATNRPDDGAGAHRLDESLRSEFDAVYNIPVPYWDREDNAFVAPLGDDYLGSWEDEVHTWCDLAATWDGDGWAPTIAAYHRATEGEWLYRWRPGEPVTERLPDYRSWHAVARLPRPLRTMRAIAARIGVEAAAHFLSWMEAAGDVAPVIHAILEGEQPEPPQTAAAVAILAENLACHGGRNEELAQCVMAWASAKLDGGPLAVIGRSIRRRLGELADQIPAWNAWRQEHAPWLIV